ncbi:hypothetical protein HDV64DRAFT_120007 [Trichoderma sp. TUCIM 5745]
MPRRHRITAFPVPLRWTTASGSHGSCDRLHSTASAGGTVDVCHSSHRSNPALQSCRPVDPTTLGLETAVPQPRATTTPVLPGKLYAKSRSSSLGSR